MAGGRAGGRDAGLQSAAGVLNRETPTSLPASQSTPRIRRANSFGGIFRLKPSDSQLTLSELRKTLTVRDLVAMGVGSTLGAGVYVLIGTAAREKAGPALPLSFLIAGIAAGMAALCYVELASRCPSAGSAYAYAYTCVGEVVAWLIGWAMILEYTVGGAAVARGISPNLAVLFGGHVPFWLARVRIPGTDITADPVAGVLVLLITMLLCSGIKESVTVQEWFMYGNVAVLLFVVVAGSYSGYTTGWQGYQQPDGYFPYGVNGVLGGAAMVFFAYIGFDTVASAAEEVEHPQRDLPLGIGLSLLACGSLYMAIAAVLVGMVSYKELDPDSPISTAFAKMGMPWAMYVTAAGALAALSTTLLGSLIPQPRILMAMARDGLLPNWFSEINSAAVPRNATVATGVVAAGMAFAMDIDQLSGMVSVGTLLAFTSVSAAILIVRYVPPTHPPPHPSTDSLQPATHPPRNRTLPTDIPNPPPGLPPRPLPRTPGLPPLPRPPSSVQAPRPTFSVGGDTEVESPPYLSPSPGEIESPLVSEEMRAANGGGLRSWNGGFRVRGGVPPPGDGGVVNSPPSRGRSLSSQSLGSPFVGEAGRPEAVHERKARRRWAGSAIGGVCIGGTILAMTTAAEDSIPAWCSWTSIAVGTPLLLGASGVLLMMPEDDGKHTFGQPHGFQCPGVPLVPIISIVVNVYLMVNLGLPTWMRTGVWLVLGALIYFLYGRQNSVLHPKQPIASPRVNDHWHEVKVEALDDFDGLEIRQPFLKVGGSF